MQPKKVRIAVALVAISLFVLPSLFGSYTDERTLTANATQEVTGFHVINSFWGTSSSPVAVAPGDRNVPLTVTLQYVFSNSATSIEGLLGLSNGFSIYNGSGTASSAVSGITPDGMIVQMTFQVYLAANMPLGTYVLPLNLSWTASGYGYVLNQTTSITVYVEGRPQLSFSTSTQTLTPGEVNLVPLVIQNTGSGSASSISITASSPTAGVLSTIPEIQSISAGGQTTFPLQVFVPLAAAGAVVSISVVATYKDPYGNSGTYSQTLFQYASTLGSSKLQFSSANQILIPGETNNVTITVLDTGTQSLSQVTTTITSGSPSVTIIDAFPYIPTLGANSSVSKVIEIYVASTAAGSPVSITLTSTFMVTQTGTSGSSSQTLGFYTTNYNSRLEFSSASQTLIPGETNSVTITLFDTGTQSLSQVTTTITSGSPSVTIIDAFPYIPTLGANSSVSKVIEIYVAPTAASSPVTITLVSSFIIMQTGTSGSSSQTLGFYTTNYNSPLVNTSINVVPVNTTITAGQSSLVSFMIENAGNSTIYAPSFSLTAAAPLVITTNSTFSSPGSTIAPKGSVLYEALLTSSPTATSGTYSGSLAVTISDKQGDERTQTFSVGFKLLGTIKIVVQDEVVAQNNATSITVSGSLLNEGQASAYYTQVNVSLISGTGSTLSSSSDYVGQLDPNSPLAFSLIVPISQSVQSGNAMLNLEITYQDNFGQVQSTTTQNKIVDLSSFSQHPIQTQTSRGTGLLVGLGRIIVLLAIVIAVVAAAVYVRRARHGTTRKATDDKVI